MNRRLSGKELSLMLPLVKMEMNGKIGLVDKELDQDLKFAQKEEMKQRKDLLKDSIKILNDREKEILIFKKT